MQEVLDTCPLISTHSLTRRLTVPWSSPHLHSQHFNSQPHKEADLVLPWFDKNLGHFNSQPHKEADNPAAPRNLHHEHFNSQPHKEADLQPVHLINRSSFISTHSLTRRLTSIYLFWCIPCLFQLTASQGGWRQKQAMTRAMKVFQLTASQGGWRTRSRNFKLISFISTHSLTRRLTLPGVCCCPTWVVFQLTASQGGWHIFNLWFGWA